MYWLGIEWRGAQSTSIQENLIFLISEMQLCLLKQILKVLSEKWMVIFMIYFSLYAFPDHFYRTLRSRVREPDLALWCSTETKQNSGAMMCMVWCRTQIYCNYFLLGNITNTINTFLNQCHLTFEKSSFYQWVQCFQMATLQNNFTMHLLNLRYCTAMMQK